MITKLKRHITRQKDDEDDVALVLDEEDDDDFSVNEAQTDPRWDGLQNISENN